MGITWRSTGFAQYKRMGFNCRYMFRLIIVISRLSPQGEEDLGKIMNSACIQISMGHFKEDRQNLLTGSETQKIPKVLFMFVIRDMSLLVNYSVPKFHLKLQIRIILPMFQYLHLILYQYHSTFTLLFEIMFVLPHQKNTEMMNLWFLSKK